MRLLDPAHIDALHRFDLIDVAVEAVKDKLAAGQSVSDAVAMDDELIPQAKFPDPVLDQRVDRFFDPILELARAQDASLGSAGKDHGDAGRIPGLGGRLPP